MSAPHSPAGLPTWVLALAAWLRSKFPIRFVSGPESNHPSLIPNRPYKRSRWGVVEEPAAGVTRARWHPIIFNTKTLQKINGAKKAVRSSQEGGTNLPSRSCSIASITPTAVWSKTRLGWSQIGLHDQFMSLCEETTMVRKSILLAFNQHQNDINGSSSSCISEL